MNPQQRIQRQLEDVLKLPGNDRCADCHASSPRWASVNLGIFLCVTCASVHRKMGTHRSRVKSVTLDEWTREQVQGMKDMGNIKSNAVYNPDQRKHRPPPNTSSDERDSELSKYIRRKYELRAFAAAAAPELATSNAVTSRSMARDARKGHPEFASVLQNHRAAPPPPPAASAGAFSVPTSPARPRPTRSATGPAWSALEPKAVSPASTGSSPRSNLAAPLNAVPPRSNSISAVSTAGKLAVSPSFTAARLPSPTPKPNLLVDIEGSTSSTRPLQVNAFPTVPAWQPQQQQVVQQQQVAPQQLPQQQFAQPTLLGQQAFASPMAAPTTNPFFANYVPQQQQMQSPVLQTPVGYPMQQSPGVYSPGLAFPQFPQQQQVQMGPMGVPVYAQQQAYPQFGQYGTYPVHM
ncbi:UBA domain-containing protein 3 [Vanrija pseudolonga]|uniref:UBA domain-containing protein 3 n=1 Tax=Vanrija pseudolonga TaxID=143232 RepID=A0AAF0Y4A0_9TREE|nr:UBA domain-containing protein 3 [Vanrija pseudolonga]